MTTKEYEIAALFFSLGRNGQLQETIRWTGVENQRLEYIVKYILKSISDLGWDEQELSAMQNKANEIQAQAEKEYGKIN